jgi:hypothetical protein
MKTDIFTRRPHRLDAVIAAIERKLQNGGEDLTVLEPFVMRVGYTTPS